MTICHSLSESKYSLSDAYRPELPSCPTSRTSVKSLSNNILKVIIRQVKYMRLSTTMMPPILLVLAGCILIMTVYFQYRNRTQPMATLYSVENKVDLNYLLSPSVLSYINSGSPTTMDADIVALLVISPTVCPPCISNMASFSDAIRKASSAEMKISLVAVVSSLGMKSTKLSHFARVINLDIPTAWSRDTKVYDRVLREHVPYFPNQILFVNVRNSSIFFRIFLMNEVPDRKRIYSAIDEMKIRFRTRR